MAIAVAPPTTTHLVYRRHTGPERNAYRYTMTALPPTKPTTIRTAWRSDGSSTEPGIATAATGSAISRSHNGRRVHVGTKVPSGNRKMNPMRAIGNSTWANLARGAATEYTSTTAPMLGG